MKLFSLLLVGAFAFAPLQNTIRTPGQSEETAGQLRIIRKDGTDGGICPLKNTKVTADISGFGARVTIVQTFTNPATTPIEAIYTFPMPNAAAVDRMTMLIGPRRIEGTIKRREEARAIYEAAKNQGQSAALLDQERPNIFTQSVANIMPGAEVKVEISYVQILKYEEGQFEFNFPMVVGPRFLGNAQDPGKIAPPITPKGTRTGSNIELTVNLDAGAPIQQLSSVLHAVNTRREGDNRVQVSLSRRDEIPNRDFILRYRTANDTVQSAFIPHRTDEKGGFFTLVLMPPKAPTALQICPKEIIFVMDQSGSQTGFPIQKSKELTLKLIKTLRPNDTFNVIGFNNTVQSLWGSPRPNTPANVKEAETFVSAMQANGGTQLRDGVIAALNGQSDNGLLRIVLFNTDGFIGDEKDVLDTIQKRRDRARMFTFGIGNSVNRFLIDAMSVEGRGDAEYVTLAESADLAVARFIRRTQSPVLTNVSAQIDGVTVSDVLPNAIPDVFSEKPVVLYGRYEGSGKGTVTLRGNLGGKPWSKSMVLDFPVTAKASAIPTLWARKQVDELTRKDWLGRLRSENGKSYTDQIVDVALDFGIMTEYTSFVAVEPKVVNIGGRQRTIRVPVEMADGVSYEGINAESALRMKVSPTRGALAPGQGLVPPGAGGGGLGGGAGGRAGATKALRDYAGAGDKRAMTPEEKHKFNLESKLSKALRTAVGPVEVQVWLNKLDQPTLDKLASKGLKIELKDDTLKIVFGTINASALEALAQFDEVDRIKRLED
jgi:Ca-activated chloride channel homolog